MTVRNYAVLYLNGRRTRSGVVVGGGGVITEGGNGVLQTGQHALDGAEHTGQLPETRLSTAETDVALRLAPDGVGGVEWSPTAAGFETPVDHGAMGATETLDFSAGTWHRGTLSANCTITVTGYTVDEGIVALVKLTQDGTGGWDITWDADVVFAGDDQPGQAAADVSWFLLWSDEGDSTVYGALVGGGSATATIETITTAETDTALRLAPDGAGGVEFVASGALDADDVRDAGRWEIVMTPGITDPPEPVWTVDGTDYVYGWVPG